MAESIGSLFLASALHFYIASHEVTFCGKCSSSANGAQVSLRVFPQWQMVEGVNDWWRKKVQYVYNLQKSFHHIIICLTSTGRFMVYLNKLYHYFVSGNMFAKAGTPCFFLSSSSDRLQHIFGCFERKLLMFLEKLLSASAKLRWNIVAEPQCQGKPWMEKWFGVTFPVMQNKKVADYRQEVSLNM